MNTKKAERSRHGYVVRVWEHIKRESVVVCESDTAKGCRELFLSGIDHPRRWREEK
jgi:hypothetical protein